MTLLLKGNQSPSLAFSKDSEEDRGLGKIYSYKEIETDRQRDKASVMIWKLSAWGN